MLIAIGLFVIVAGGYAVGNHFANNPPDYSNSTELILGGQTGLQLVLSDCPDKPCSINIKSQGKSIYQGTFSNPETRSIALGSGSYEVHLTGHCGYAQTFKAVVFPGLGTRIGILKFWDTVGFLGGPGC